MPPDLVDDVVGRPIPDLTLASTDGSQVSIGALGEGRTVLSLYPLTGQPGADLPAGWNTIPGARGCTAEACGFRDHHDDLRAAGAAHVFGLSSQNTDYQRALVERLRLPFPMLSDPMLQLARCLGLPTFQADGRDLHSRLTLVVTEGRIEKVFHPVPDPGAHAEEVLAWLTSALGA